MTGSVAAILLAAGKSRRMGRCKQLLPFGETTVIGRCLETLITAGISDIVAVVSSEGREVVEAAQKYPVRIAVNNLPDGDMASSVLVGRSALSPEVSGVIIALCDYPLLTPSTVARLVRQHHESPGFIIMPTHDGRRGHPVLFPRSVLDELAADLSLRDLVQREPARNYHLAVTDEGVLLDMDTPEDYDKMREKRSG
jgi:molybdenum cofactor cytidylyltransferase